MGGSHKETTDGIARRDMLKLAGAAVVGMGGVALAGGPALAASVGPGDTVGVRFFSLSDGTFTDLFNELVTLRMRSGRADQGQGEAAPSGPAFEVVLKGGLNASVDLYNWFAAALGGKKTGKRNAQIVGFDATGTALVRWNLTSAFPSEIDITTVSNNLSVQVTIVAASITRG